MIFSMFLADAIEILIRIQRIMVFNRPTFNGIKHCIVKAVEVNSDSMSVDTIKDLERVRNLLRLRTSYAI